MGNPKLSKIYLIASLMIMIPNIWDKAFKNGPSKIFWSLASTNFTFSIPEYFVPYVDQIYVRRWVAISNKFQPISDQFHTLQKTVSWFTLQINWPVLHKCNIFSENSFSQKIKDIYTTYLVKQKNGKRIVELLKCYKSNCWKKFLQTI